MKVATTAQFRKVVKKVAAKKGFRIWTSYTNKTTVGGNHRTVGFGMIDASDKLAAKIEKKLNKKGLTAKTRCTTGGSMPSGMNTSGSKYIRGTCILA